MNCIYAYKKIDKDKILYIGKTNNIENRKRHKQNNLDYPIRKKPVSTILQKRSTTTIDT